MKSRGTEDHKMWLFDLAHSNLSEIQVVRGFLKYYVLEGFTLEHVQNDLVFRSFYGPQHAGQAMENLRITLEKIVNGKIELMDTDAKSIPERRE